MVLANIANFIQGPEIIILIVVIGVLIFGKRLEIFLKDLWAKTMPSNKELDANLLAPWRPDLVTSPQAYRFLIEVFPFLLILTPPQI